TGPARSAELANVPTMIECGLPGLTTVTHYGFLGPAGIPADVVARLNDAMNEGLKPADVRANMINVGIEPTGGSPQDFAAVIAQQLQQWAGRAGDPLPTRLAKRRVGKGALLGSRARAAPCTLPFVPASRALFHSSPRHSSVRPREKRGPS